MSSHTISALLRRLATQQPVGYPEPAPWNSWPVLGRFYRSAGFVGILSIAGFLWYYLAPNILASATGNGISPELAGQLRRFVSAPWLTVVAANNIEMPAFQDLVHFAFAFLVILLGANFARLSIRVGMGVLPVLSTDSGLSVARDQYKEITTRLMKRIHSPGLVVLPAVAFVGTVLSFWELQQAPGLTNWWAHDRYGFAGKILAVNVAGVIAAGMFYGQVLMWIMSAYFHLFKLDFKLRPLHPDGCGGFMPFGLFLLTVYITFALGGLGFAAILWKGYFGLEMTALYWGSVVFYLALVFLAVFGPMITYSLRLDEAKRQALAAIERRFAAATEDLSETPEESGAPPPLEDISILYDTYAAHRLTPFGGRAFAVLTGSYLAQIAAGVYGLL